MSAASLERGYRRLLACYPERFRAEQADEMLAVLMEGACRDHRPGDRRGAGAAGLAEAGPDRDGRGRRVMFTVHSWFPYPLQLLTTSVYLLEVAALTVSPGPRHGRHLLNWGHGVTMLLAAGAVQASTLWDDSKTGIARILVQRPQAALYLLVIGLALAVVTMAAAVALRVNWYLLLLLAVTAYPYVLQLANDAAGNTEGLIGNPTPLHLTMLYTPVLLVAVGAIAFALWRRLPGAQAAPDEVTPA